MTNISYTARGRDGDPRHPIVAPHEAPVTLINWEAWSEDGINKAVEVYSDGSRRHYINGAVEEVGSPPAFPGTRSHAEQEEELQAAKAAAPLHGEGVATDLSDSEMHQLASQHEKSVLAVTSLPPDVHPPLEEGEFYGDDKVEEQTKPVAEVAEKPAETPHAAHKKATPHKPAAHKPAAKKPAAPKAEPKSD